MNEFGARLKSARKKAKLTRQVVADKLIKQGIKSSSQSIFNYESERTYPSIDKVYKLAEIYQIKIGKLLN